MVLGHDCLLPSSHEGYDIVRFIGVFEVLARCAAPTGVRKNEGARFAVLSELQVEDFFAG
jgi:hypothetical protein